MATVDSLVVKRPARELAMGDWVARFQKDSGAFSGWFMIVAPWKNDDVIGIAADGSTTRIGCTADELLDVWCGLGQPSGPVTPAPLPLPRDRRLEADITESTRLALCTPGRAVETITALCTRVWNRARKDLEEVELAEEKKTVADLRSMLRLSESTHDEVRKSLEGEILQLKTQLGLLRLEITAEREYHEAATEGLLRVELEGMQSGNEPVAPEVAVVEKGAVKPPLDPVRFHAIAAYEAERNRQGSVIAQPADAAKALLGALATPLVNAVFRDRDKEVFFAAFILGYRKATSVWMREPENAKGKKMAPKTEQKPQSNEPAELVDLSDWGPYAALHPEELERRIDALPQDLYDTLEELDFIHCDGLTLAQTAHLRRAGILAAYDFALGQAAKLGEPPWGVKRHISLPLSFLPTQPGWGACRVWERWSRQAATHEYYVAVPPEGVDMPAAPDWLGRIFVYAREQGAEGVLFDSCSTTKKDPYTSPL